MVQSPLRGDSKDHCSSLAHDRSGRSRDADTIAEFRLILETFPVEPVGTFAGRS
jgi:hypothetical protein